MNKKTVTGRTPSQPEWQSLHGTPTQQELERIAARQVAFHHAVSAPYGINAGADILDSAEQFFIDVLTGKRAPATKGRWSSTTGQMQNIQRTSLVDADYEKMEQRVAAHLKTNEDNADE